MKYPQNLQTCYVFHALLIVSVTQLLKDSQVLSMSNEQDTCHRRCRSCSPETCSALHKLLIYSRNTDVLQICGNTEFQTESNISARGSWLHAQHGVAAEMAISPPHLRNRSTESFLAQGWQRNRRSSRQTLLEMY